MGSLGQHLPANDAYRQRVQAFWDSIQRRVRALPLDWSKVKVYQDGLPDAEPEVIAKILSEVQSPNYGLLRWLVAQGAELVGTESPALLAREYGYLQAVISARDEVTKARARGAYAQVAGALLLERDAYVARRVAETLPADGVGVLLLGSAHQVARHLPSDIVVRQLPDDAGMAASRNAPRA